MLNNKLGLAFVSDKVSGERVKEVMEHIWKLQEFCHSMIKVETDDFEYAYLKAIVLFSPGECNRLQQHLGPYLVSMEVVSGR